MASEVHERLTEDLTQDEINHICRPLTQGAAQIRYLREVLKLPVARRPDGTPLVWRRHLDAQRPGQQAGTVDDSVFNFTKQ